MHCALQQNGVFAAVSGQGRESKARNRVTHDSFLQPPLREIARMPALGPTVRSMTVVAKLYTPLHALASPFLPRGVGGHEMTSMAIDSVRSHGLACNCRQPAAASGPGTGRFRARVVRAGSGVTPEFRVPARRVTRRCRYHERCATTSGARNNKCK